MKRLITYSKNGHDFELLKRSGDIALFRGVSRHNGTETFEVIEIQSHDGREIAGKHFEPAEFAPSNEQWGSKGWTFQTLEDADNRFREKTATA